MSHCVCLAKRAGKILQLKRTRSGNETMLSISGTLGEVSECKNWAVKSDQTSQNTIQHGHAKSIKTFRIAFAGVELEMKLMMMLMMMTNDRLGTLISRYLFRFSIKFNLFSLLFFFFLFFFVLFWLVASARLIYVLQLTKRLIKSRTWFRVDRSACCIWLDKFWTA